QVVLVRRVALVNQVVAQFVGRADLGAAALARVVKRVLVDQVGGGIVNDVGRLDALVVGLDPGVDPERLDADDLLLLVGHRPGNIHHVDNHGDAFGFANLLPASILFVFPDG